jgi:hypothetical protein
VGRKRIEASQQRSSLSFRVADDFYLLLQKVAGSEDISISELARYLMQTFKEEDFLDAAKKIKISRLEIKSLSVAQLNVEVSRAQKMLDHAKAELARRKTHAATGIDPSNLI